MPTSDFLTDEFVDRAIEQINDEFMLGIALLAFSRTVIDRPENWDKIKDAYSGNAIDLMIKMTLRELRLWCVRLLEPNGHSLVQVASRLPQLREKIVAARFAANPKWSDDQLEVDVLSDQIEDFCLKVKQLSESLVATELRIVRDEHFAHLLKGISAFRKRKTTRSDDGYTWSEVTDLMMQLLESCAQLKRIWFFHVHSVESSVSSYQRYCEGFWKLLPNLKNAEETLVLEKLSRDFPELFPPAP